MEDHNEFYEQPAVETPCETCANLDYKEKFMSVMADFQNFKKRTAAEQSSWSSAAKTGVILDFLPLNDELDRILENKPAQPSEEAQVWLTAVASSVKLFQSILSKYNVSEVPCKGQFDPELHEVISEASAAPEVPQGQILGVCKKGYLQNQKVIRHAQVVVAKAQD